MKGVRRRAAVHGGEEGGGDESGRGEAEAEAPNPNKLKLDEGFYEIEDIRRKRVRKGHLQYLIKWRGWPETANTWEPLDNIQSCADIIDAFEKRSRSPKSSRKRKRRYAGPHAVPKKKRSAMYLAEVGEGSPASPLADNQRQADGMAHTNAAGREAQQGIGTAPRVKVKSGKHADGKDTAAEEEDGKGFNAKGSLDVMKDVHKDDREAGASCMEERLGLSCIQGTTTHGSVDLPGACILDGSTDGAPKAECTQNLDDSRCVGAKRRKSASVRRFKQDSTPCSHVGEVAGSGEGSLTLGGRLRNEVVGSNEVGVNDKDMLDGHPSRAYITKILKAFEFGATVSDNLQEVSVKFMALRSDGKQVIVDNSYLKLNNPLLLISFYEEHLRCPQRV